MEKSITKTGTKVIMVEPGNNLILEKAREWYKKGGYLKTVALQSFSKEELIREV